jgi:hypothetical protein
MKLKIFEHFNSETPCPLCKETTDLPCILVPIIGTNDGMNCEAIQVHEECLAMFLAYDREHNLIYAI